MFLAFWNRNGLPYRLLRTAPPCALTSPATSYPVRNFCTSVPRGFVLVGNKSHSFPPTHGFGLYASTACWINRFPALNSKASLIASFVFLTLNEWPMLKSVCVNKG